MKESARRAFIWGILKGQLQCLFAFSSAPCLCSCLRQAACLYLPAYVHSSVGRLLSPTAQAQSRVRSLLDRVRGKTMPEGIVKTNGRIEATQVDVSAKYPGRLVDVTVEEGSEVKEGQVVGRISSPEYEAQLRAAQSNVERAKQSMAEAESLIAQRNAMLASAKSDFERGRATYQEADYHPTGLRSAAPQLRSGPGKRPGSDCAARSSRRRHQERGGRGRAHRIGLTRFDSCVAENRTSAIPARAERRGGRCRRKGPDDPRPARCLHDDLPAGGERRPNSRSVARPASFWIRLPQYVIPASVSFVAADAQFTPKTVETADEREKLMFRVKLKLDAEVLKQYSTEG